MLNETDTFFNWAPGILQTTLDGVRNTEAFISGKNILDKMTDRSGQVCCAQA